MLTDFKNSFKANLTVNLQQSNSHKKPSYRWGTARRGRASWNLV